MYGKTYMGVERSTFVIAADGTLAKVMRKVKPETHADDVLAALGCDVRRLPAPDARKRGRSAPFLHADERT